MAVAGLSEVPGPRVLVSHGSAGVTGLQGRRGHFAERGELLFGKAARTDGSSREGDGELPVCVRVPSGRLPVGSAQGSRAAGRGRCRRVPRPQRRPPRGRKRPSSPSAVRERPGASRSVQERATTWQKGELQVKNIELSLGGAILNAFAYYSDIYCQKETHIQNSPDNSFVVWADNISKTILRSKS